MSDEIKKPKAFECYQAAITSSIEVKSGPTAGQRDAYATTVPLIESPASTSTPLKANAADRPIVVTKRRCPKPLRSEAFIGPLGDWVRRIAPHTEADEPAMLVQGLIAAGSVFGRTNYKWEGGKRQHPNENAVIVGESARARKGTAGSHVTNLWSQVDEQWSRGRVVNGLGSGEGIVAKCHDGIFENIAAKKENERSIRVEKEPAVEDKRLMIHEPEFAGLLASSTRIGATVSATIRKAWDGEQLGNVTKANPLTATDAHVSIAAHITIDELTSCLAKKETANGFANRFLWVFAKRARILEDGDKVHRVNVDDIVTDLRDAASRARSTREWDFDEEARSLWRPFYRADAECEGMGILNSLSARAGVHIQRLALIYAMLDPDASTFACEGFIGARHFLAAKAVWDYCHESAEIIFAGFGLSRTAELIFDQIRHASNGLTRTELSNAFNGKLDKANRDEAMRQLGGRIVTRPVNRPSAKKTTDAYFLASE